MKPPGKLRSGTEVDKKNNRLQSRKHKQELPFLFGIAYAVTKKKKGQDRACSRKFGLGWHDFLPKHEELLAVSSVSPTPHHLLQLPFPSYPSLGHMNLILKTEILSRLLHSALSKACSLVLLY
jgi:hypothetical protein